MATNFPSSLDTFTNPTATDTLDSPPHDQQHANINDAVEALEAKVGVNSSAVTSSLDYKVGALESRPVETKTASYTLVATDVNKRIVMNSAGATTITVNDSVFAAGDTVWIHNIGAGTTTVTAGTATVNTAGSLDVGQWEGGSLYFTSASSAIFFRGGGAGVANANFTDTATGTFTDGGTDYKYLIFTSSGTVTFDTDGLADFLVVAGGAGAGTWRSGSGTSGGGGAGGCLERLGFYITAGTYTVTVGAGGSGTTRFASSAKGSGSSVGTILRATGGGGGGVGSDVNQSQWGAGIQGWGGGSGGGGNQGWLVSGFGGIGVDGQGVKGGDFNVGGGYGIGGGGGGWGGTGGPSGIAQPANGGPGDISTIITASIATSNSVGEVSGSDVYYGGGGAGRAYFSTYNGTGGIGGGGNVATAGTANTGGGGGGSNTINVAGAAGGSGVVIIRVAV